VTPNVSRNRRAQGPRQRLLRRVRVERVVSEAVTNTRRREKKLGSARFRMPAGSGR